MPVALLGKTSISKPMQFVPRADEKINRILDFKAGDYELELRLNTASPDNALPFLKTRNRPLRFLMQTHKMNYLRFNKTGTQAMWSKDARSATTSAQ